MGFLIPYIQGRRNFINFHHDSCLQVQEVASFQGKPLKELFSIFKQPICKFVVDAIEEIQSRDPAAKVSLDTVLEVASVFEFKDVQSFLKVTGLNKCFYFWSYSGLL